MPFDNTNFAEPSVHNVEEIAILDRMAKILATPDRWCKRAYEERRWFGLKRAYCVIGALGVASKVPVRDVFTKGIVAEPTYNVADRLYQQTPGGPMWFNDAPTTTHADVLDLIARTRASFLGENPV